MSSNLIPTIAETAPAEMHELSAGRSKRLLHGVVTTLLGKGATMAVNFFTVPLAIHYLGTESFGIWTTISTGLAMLLVLDLGVANSLTNFLSEAYAKSDTAHAQRFATSALAVMTCIAAGIALIAWFGWGYVPWLHVFRISSPAVAATVSKSSAAALVVFLVGLPASLAQKILGSYQEFKVANAFTATGSLLNFVAVYALVRFHASLPALVAASAGALVLANIACLVWIFTRHKPWLRPRWKHVDAVASRNLIASGGELFIIQLAGLVVFNSDNLIVAHYLGANEVASYSLAWRLVGYASVLQTMIVPSLWPAFSEAFHSGDYVWVKRIFVRACSITMGTAAAFVLLIGFLGRAFIRLWAGQAAVPTQGLIWLMCCWILISTFMNNTATVLIARSKTRVQAWCSLVAAVANLWLSMYLVPRIGSSGAVLGTIGSYLLILVIPQTWIAWRIIHGDEQ